MKILIIQIRFSRPNIQLIQPCSSTTCSSVSHNTVLITRCLRHILSRTLNGISGIWLKICGISASRMGCQCFQFSCRGPEMAGLCTSVATAGYFDIFRQCLYGRALKVSDIQTGRSLRISNSWRIWSPSSYSLRAFLTLNTRPTYWAVTVSFAGN